MYPAFFNCLNAVSLVLCMCMRAGMRGVSGRTRANCGKKETRCVQIWPFWDLHLCAMWHASWRTKSTLKG